MHALVVTVATTALLPLLVFVSNFPSIDVSRGILLYTCCMLMLGSVQSSGNLVKT